MPGLDGLDVVRRLRAEGVSAPFILLSAYLTAEATVDAMRLGAVDVVDKLTDIEVHDPMPASVGEFLDRQRLVPPDHEGVRALRRRLAPSLPTS